jgi:hypothetical protein
LTNEINKNWVKLGEGLTKVQLEKKQYVLIKKTLLILLAISVVTMLTLVAATAMGMKSPGYEQGFEAGYRASYQAAFDGDLYNVKAGLGDDDSYNDGYQHGYDEGYPSGQQDRSSQTIINKK